VFTNGIVSTGQGWKIALYFTGRQHAGENLADVLQRRVFSASLRNPVVPV
jgi:transposase